MALLYKIFSGIACSNTSSTISLYWGTINGNPLPGQIVTNGSGVYYSVLPVPVINSNFTNGYEISVLPASGIINCPGITSRVFAYNPSQINIPGTTNIGTLSIGVDEQDYSLNPGGLTWWGGPNEKWGYCIGTVVTAQNQSTQLGPIGSVKFWRTTIFTESAFIGLANDATGKSFTNSVTACAYLDTNSYWTSYNNVNSYYYLISNRSSRSIYAYRDIDNNKIQIKSFVRPNTTPAYTLYLKLGKTFGQTPVELENNYVGSPAQYTYGGSGAQYTYGKKHWYTEVWVYTDGGSNIVYKFPYGGTTTYGEQIYKNIVIPWIP